MDDYFLFPRRKMAKILGVSATTVWKRIQILKQNKELISWYSKGRPSIYKRARASGHRDS